MPDVTIKTNKDIYAAVGINGYPSEFCTDMRFYDPEHGDILIPAGTEFTVIDIFINRMEEMFGQSHTAFFVLATMWIFMTRYAWKIAMTNFKIGLLFRKCPSESA